MTIEPSNPSDEEIPRNSVFGIAALFSGSLAFLLFLLLGLDFYFAIKGSSPEISPLESGVSNTAFCGIPIVVLAGIVFGFIGLKDKNSKKKISTIGLVLSFLMGVLYCIGLALALLAMGGWAPYLK
jgi:hypothetical protein